MRTRFCEAIFWGKGFAKPRLIFLAGILDFARAQEGSGEECARAGIQIFGGVDSYLKLTEKLYIPILQSP